MRLLTYTNLYPSAELPRHGIFVEERLRQLVRTGRIEANVCAIRPRTSLDPRLYAGRAAQAGDEIRHGIKVRYVPVPTLPLLTNWVDPLIWARVSRREVATLVGDATRKTIIDAHFLYPDAVAAVLLGRRLGVPVVMTARGSDVNVKCENPVMRRWISWAARHCSAVITVSQALADKLHGMGIVANDIRVLRNGVDLEKFKPGAGSFADRKPGGAVLLSVGHLLEGKGHHIAIEALKELPEYSLLIVGEGPWERSLRDLSERIGVASRVRFLGLVPHGEMASLYCAATFTVLASRNEGMPNVILESLACGTRVIATNAGGIGEVVTDSVAGMIMSSRTPDALIAAVRAAECCEQGRAETRAFAERFGWDETVRQQLSLYERVLEQPGLGAPMAAGEPSR